MYSSGLKFTIGMMMIKGENQLLSAEMSYLLSEERFQIYNQRSCTLVSRWSRARAKAAVLPSVRHSTESPQKNGI